MASKNKIGVRGSKRVSAPVLRAKQRPRGRPFEKENRIGAATRFRKGEPSPNPGGRPKYAKLSETLRAILPLTLDEDFQPRTHVEKIALKAIKLAGKGNMSAVREVGDRTEGKPATTISLQEQREDPLTQLIEIMHAEAARLGPPEGKIPYRPDLKQLPQSTEATDGE
jgi:hypothetical protein